MQSSFQLAAGVITLPALDYTVPGAQIHSKARMPGGRRAELCGHGEDGGFVREWLAGGRIAAHAGRPPLQERRSGDRVPIHIEGTREQPKFAIGLNRMKPDEKR